jgi:hypothetical protein
MFKVSLQSAILGLCLAALNNGYVLQAAATSDLTWPQVERDWLDLDALEQKKRAEKARQEEEVDRKRLDNQRVEDSIQDRKRRDDAWQRRRDDDRRAAAREADRRWEEDHRR